MISLIFIILCPFLFFFIIKKVGWKLFLASFLVLILLSVIYFNKVKIAESFNCFDKKPIKAEHIYDYIKRKGVDGKLEITKIYIVADFCDCKENIMEVLDFYKKLPKADSVISVRVIQKNDYIQKGITSSSNEDIDWGYINTNLNSMSFTMYKRGTEKEDIWLCKTDDILDYNILKKDTVSCNINMKYKEIKRETLQKILNTVDKMSFHKKIEKFTYKIQNSIATQTEIIIAFSDFGKKINLEII